MRQEDISINQMRTSSTNDAVHALSELKTIEIQGIDSIKQQLEDGHLDDGFIYEDMDGEGVESESPQPLVAKS